MPEHLWVVLSLSLVIKSACHHRVRREYDVNANTLGAKDAIRSPLEKRYGTINTSYRKSSERASLTAKRTAIQVVTLAPLTEHFPIALHV